MKIRRHSYNYSVYTAGLSFTAVELIGPFTARTAPLTDVLVNAGRPAMSLSAITN